MFAFFVILVLPLALAVLLGDVDGAACQVSQQVLDQKGRFAGLLGNANIEIGGPVGYKTNRWHKKLSFVLGNDAPYGQTKAWLDESSPTKNRKGFP